MSDHSATADLTGWLGQFQRDCDAAIADLTQVCSAAAQAATYQQQIENYRFGVARIILERPEELSAVASQRAARTCFLNVIGKYIGFLDKLIASKRLNHIVLDRDISTMEEFQTFVNECLERETANVSNTVRSNPRKIDCFPNASAFARDTSRAYFQLRRALEHYNDIPENDLVVPTQRIGFLAGNEEIKTLGVTLRQGEGLFMKMFNEELRFAAGRTITLSPQNAYDLVFTMRMVLAPEVFRSHIETPQGDSPG